MSPGVLTCNSYGAIERKISLSFGFGDINVYPCSGRGTPKLDFSDPPIPHPSLATRYHG